ncbi:hypothetical protein KQR56_14135 [Bacillus velezensis]|nr:hypothetical protein [Bacillus velezensis]
MPQHETPLYSGLKKHADRQPVQFHIPGHKKAREWIRNSDNLSEKTR